MKIPVFVSSPTALNPRQEESRWIILDELLGLRLQPRARPIRLPHRLPLREVYVIAKHCSGWIILGFGQFYAQAGTWKRGTEVERATDKPMSLPTLWNQREAGVLVSLPLLM